MDYAVPAAPICAACPIPTTSWSASSRCCGSPPPRTATASRRRPRGLPAAGDGERARSQGHVRERDHGRGLGEGAHPDRASDRARGAPGAGADELGARPRPLPLTARSGARSPSTRPWSRPRSWRSLAPTPRPRRSASTRVAGCSRSSSPRLMGSRLSFRRGAPYPLERRRCRPFRNRAMSFWEALLHPTARSCASGRRSSRPRTSSRSGSSSFSSSPITTGTAGTCTGFLRRALQRLTRCATACPPGRATMRG